VNVIGGATASATVTFTRPFELPVDVPNYLLTMADSLEGYFFVNGVGVVTYAASVFIVPGVFFQYNNTVPKVLALNFPFSSISHVEDSDEFRDVALFQSGEAVVAPGTYTVMGKLETFAQIQGDVGVFAAGSNFGGMRIPTLTGPTPCRSRARAACVYRRR